MSEKRCGNCRWWKVMYRLGTDAGVCMHRPIKKDDWFLTGIDQTCAHYEPKKEGE